MAYNTKPIVTDVGGNPISQYYNKDLDRYEPVEGSGGGNKVVLYNADGSENNELSLTSILDKLSQLTGTVIDEEIRKSNELQRIEFYNQLQQMLADGELKGDKGDTGLGLEFHWQGTSLGVRIEGDTEYVYVDLRGPQGEKGDTGSIENLDAQHIEDALGYVPASQDDLNNIDVSEDIKIHNEDEESHPSLIQQLNEIATDLTGHKAEYASLIEGGQVFTAVLKNGWTGTLEYSKNDLGVVHLRGDIKPDSTKGTVITTLPTGYRPKGFANHSFVHFKNYGDYKPQIGCYVVSDGNILCKASDLTEGQSIWINTTFKIG